jgi:type IV pilus biogenesis protein CpaD/CtpE
MDPLTRDDVWRPTHINEANLELQVAHPSDLTVGRGTLTADGDTAAKAVDRLRNDKVKTLPSASISSVGQSGGGS